MHLSCEVLARVLRQLLSEQISIRNMQQILEAMIHPDYDGTPYTVFDPEVKACRRPESDWFDEPINLASLARIRLSRYISHKYQQRDNTLVVYLLDREIEALLTNQRAEGMGAFLARLDSTDRDRILAASRAQFSDQPDTTQTPSVLTTSSVRPVFRQLITSEFPRVAVLCYRELSPALNIQAIGRVSLSE